MSSDPYVDPDDLIREALRVWTPPPRRTLSQWADEHYYLSAESSAEPGRWRTLPYQRAIMDAFTDPRIECVSVMKSARVGLTKIFNALVGYCLHQTPCPILVVQPTVKDGEGYSKEEIAPMLRDCPVLARIVFEDAKETGPRDGGNTILHKRFPGGVLSLVGANSGTGFRRVSRRIVLFDEADAYPESAGADGDPIELGVKRTEYFWDRKIGVGSTPLVAGASRIERLFEEGDQRRYYVPCPSCGHMAPFVFRGDAGHSMTWPEGRPEEAFFTCQANGCVIEHRQKRWMVERGEWRAGKPHTAAQLERGRLHVSFHIWAAYSYSPNSTWGQIAEAFVKAQNSPEKLRTFVNTVLGETWKELGEAPAWERLYSRRESYPIGSVPAGVRIITAGVDVQQDRWVYEVVGWGLGKESWSLEAGVIPGDTSNDAEWVKLDELLARSYHRADGREEQILCLAVDSGYRTNTVYNWARLKPMSRVLAVKGMERARTILGAPSPVDVTVSGRRITRGYKVWPVGSSVAKDELYGWLGLKSPEPGKPLPPGWCHFPEYDETYFRELTAEQLVKHVNAKGFAVYQWELIPGRQNHFLDCRIYARAAAAFLRLDRMRAPAGAAPPAPAPAASPTEASASSPPAPRPPPPRPAPRGGGFLGGGRARGKGWLKGG